MKSFQPLLSSTWGTGQNSATSMSHISHTPAEPSYLFDEGCCLQAAFAISHLILELLPELLEVICLPQNVVLMCGVLLAELPAPLHHICTYSPMWIALCFKSLAQGQGTCQHSSFPTSQERRVAEEWLLLSATPEQHAFPRASCLIFWTPLPLPSSLLARKRRWEKQKLATFFCPLNVS